MLKRSLTFLFLLLMLFLSACDQGEPAAEEPDTDATVEAAISATQAAAPTNTPPPTDTPVPPTETSIPPTEPPAEPSPTAETAEEEMQTLDLNEAGVAFSPQGRNFATDMTFRLTVEGEVASELAIDGVANADGSSTLTYDFSNTNVEPVVTAVEIIEKEDTTYFNLSDGTCVSSEMGDLPVSEMVLNTGTIVLEPENLVTGQLQWNGVTEVNGVSTNEYLIDAGNLTGTAGITNMSNGVLNIAEDGNYVVRLILEGTGNNELLAPGVTGDLYYELNLSPSETPFEIEVPENCIGMVDVGDVGDGDSDSGDADTGDGGETDTGEGDTGAGEAGSGAAGGEFVISQVSQNVSHQCQGDNVVVQGASNTITLTGNCNEVVVHSAGNTMTIESAAAIVVNGAGNNITYGGSPAITDNGLNNTLTQQ